MTLASLATVLRRSRVSVDMVYNIDDVFDLNLDFPLLAWSGFPADLHRRANATPYPPLRLLALVLLQLDYQKCQRFHVFVSYKSEHGQQAPGLNLHARVLTGGQAMCSFPYQTGAGAALGFLE